MSVVPLDSQHTGRRWVRGSKMQMEGGWVCVGGALRRIQVHKLLSVYPQSLAQAYCD